MGAHATLRITRDRAIRYLLEAMATCPDGDIEQMMDIFLDERLYNCRIVDSDQENDHERL